MKMPRNIEFAEQNQPSDNSNLPNLDSSGRKQLATFRRIGKRGTDRGKTYVKRRPTTLR